MIDHENTFYGLLSTINDPTCGFSTKVGFSIRAFYKDELIGNRLEQELKVINLGSGEETLIKDCYILDEVSEENKSVVKSRFYQRCTMWLLGYYKNDFKNEEYEQIDIAEVG